MGWASGELPKARISVVAELGMVQDSAQLLTRSPEARKVLHLLHSKRKKIFPQCQSVNTLELESDS